MQEKVDNLTQSASTVTRFKWYCIYSDTVKMVFGAIYGYYQKGQEIPVYIGMVSGPYSVESALANRHRKHLHSTSGKFDKLLKKNGLEAFELRIIEKMEAQTQCQLRAILKPRERQIIRMYRPVHNTKLCFS